MESSARSTPGSILPGPNNGLESASFEDDIRQLMTEPHENASSFTALLELPTTQAIELIHLSDPGNYPPPRPETLTFPADAALVERAARFSVFAGERNENYSPETSSVPSNSSANVEKVKAEPAETEASQPISPDRAMENQSQNLNQNHRPGKRKERENKAKGSTKKSKTSANDRSGGGEKLPYVHVRARRGQATDSHSLAERARREKINARMKLLQDLVPGCNKISGTALVLDEIINHVQSLQRQVEFLSMRLAAVNPRIDFNLHSMLAAEGASFVDSGFPGMVTPMMWPEVQLSTNRQHVQPQWPAGAFLEPVWGKEDNNNDDYVADENSLSTALHPNRVKTEL